VHTKKRKKWYVKSSI